MSLALAALLALSCSVGRPAFAAVYTWVDERGVVHMTDRKTPDQGLNVKTLEDAPRPAVSESAGRKEAILAELTAARDMPGFVELKKIAEEYRRTHTYSKADYFVCVDMALEMENILTTRKFTSQVVAGNVTVDTAGMDPAKLMETFNHAWVVVTLAPNVHVAVETTGGFVVDADQPNFQYYYQGLVFTSARQAKETDDLIHAVNDDCAKAKEMIQDWNRNYVGRPVDVRIVETKGRVDAKVAECNTAQQRYQDLIKKQYHTLY